MKVISFINMKGGVAKTTMAVNVADCLSRRFDKKVLLIDVDPQYNATQCLMKAVDYYEYKTSGKDTIIDIFERESHLDVSLLNGNMETEPVDINKIRPVHIKNCFDLIPGALDLYKIEMSAGEGKEFGIKQYLSSLKKDEYDYVIIDTPPTPSVWMTSALLASDFYLIPTKCDPISLTGIDLLYSIILTKTNRYGISLECCGVVLTIAERSTNLYNNALTNLKSNDKWKNKLFKNSLCKRTEMAREQLNQKFILDMEDSQIKSDLNNIVREMLNKIGDNIDD